jgi:hypothetical protein
MASQPWGRPIRHSTPHRHERRLRECWCRDLVVLSRTDDTSQNGGLPTSVVVEGLSFYNAVPLTLTLEVNSTTIDIANVPWPPVGTSMVLRPELLSAETTTKRPIFV